MPNTAFRHPHTGSVLIVSLLIMLVLTVLGIAATTTTGIQEKMAHNTREMNLALQAAESALQNGETWIAAQLVVPIPENSCTTPPCAASNDVWTSAAVAAAGGVLGFNWAQNAREYGYDYETSNNVQDIPGVIAEPRYIIEQALFDPDSLAVGITATSGRYYYQISARANGQTAESSPIVQSVYARAFN
jgi:Tfp pilus assembly protein PilX